MRQRHPNQGAFSDEATRILTLIVAQYPFGPLPPQPAKPPLRPGEGPSQSEDDLQNGSRGQVTGSGLRHCARPLLRKTWIPVGSRGRPPARPCPGSARVARKRRRAPATDTRAEHVLRLLKLPVLRVYPACLPALWQRTRGTMAWSVSVSRL